MALTTADYTTLESELTGDPAAIGYAGISDAAAAAALVAQTRTQAIDVPAGNVEGLWYALGCWQPVFELSCAATTGNAATDAAILAAKGFVMTVQADGAFRASNPAIQPKLVADLVTLEGAGALSADQVTATEALMSQMTSRAALIGLPQLVGYDAPSVVFHVSKARAS